MLNLNVLNNMVAAALQEAGIPAKEIKPLSDAHRNFQSRSRGNGGPAQKHGLSLAAYFDLKLPAHQRRGVYVSA